MDLSIEELAILREINNRHLVTRSDLVKAISAKTANFSLSSIDRLIDRGLVKKVSGITLETSYIITQTGVRYVNSR